MKASHIRVIHIFHWMSQKGVKPRTCWRENKFWLLVIIFFKHQPLANLDSALNRRWTAITSCARPISHGGGIGMNCTCTYKGSLNGCKSPMYDVISTCIKYGIDMKIKHVRWGILKCDEQVILVVT